MPSIAPIAFRNADVETMQFHFQSTQDKIKNTCYSFKSTTGMLDFKLSEPLTSKYEISNRYEGNIIDPGMSLDCGSEHTRSALVQGDIDGLERIHQKFVDIFYEKNLMECNYTREEINNIISSAVVTKTKDDITYSPEIKFRFKYHLDKQGKTSVKDFTKLRTYDGNPLLVDNNNQLLPAGPPEDLVTSIPRYSRVTGVFRVTGVNIKQNQTKNKTTGKMDISHSGTIAMSPIKVKVVGNDAQKFVTPTYNLGDEDPIVAGPTEVKSELKAELKSETETTGNEEVENPAKRARLDDDTIATGAASDEAAESDDTEQSGSDETASVDSGAEQTKIEIAA